MLSKVRYAGFWVRLIADWIDSVVLDVATCILVGIILCGIYGITVIFFYPLGSIKTFFSTLEPVRLQIALGMTRCVLALLYFTLGTSYYGTTLGKRLFHIYVVSEKDLKPPGLGQSLIRCISYLGSYLPFCAGFWMAAFHPKKKALHDLIAGTFSRIDLECER